jgi:hypothetical protein
MLDILTMTVNSCFSSTSWKDAAIRSAEPKFGMCRPEGRHLEFLYFEVRDSFPNTSKVTKRTAGFSKIRMLLGKMCRNADLQDTLRLLHFQQLPYFSSTYSGEIFLSFCSARSTWHLAPNLPPWRPVGGAAFHSRPSPPSLVTSLCAVKKILRRFPAGRINSA